MQNKKRTNILLIIITLIIWGGIFYKYLWKNKQTHVTRSIPKQKREISNNKKINDFSLLGNYRDPFVYDQKNIIHIKLQDSNSKQSSKITPPPINDKIYASTSHISYKGFIKYQNKISGILILSGKLILIEDKDKVGSFIVKNIYADSVVLMQSKIKYVILKL